MAIICMAVFDTTENDRTKFTYATLNCIKNTVDLSKHALCIIDNGSCADTQEVLKEYYNHKNTKVILLKENLGTARAVNIGWELRAPGQNAIKMDNDVIVHQKGWVDEMEEAIKREPQIGIVGLKRKDLWQYPGHPEPQYKSELIMLPHEAGERWIVVERTKDIMGTCTMFNSALLDKIGYLYQPSLYGYDDVLASYRSELSGFINVFLPHIHIDHIDPGGTLYCDWKRGESGRVTQDVIKIVDEYISGTRPLYYE